MQLVKWRIEPESTDVLLCLTQQDGQTNTLQLGFDQQLYEKNAQETLTVGEAIDIIINLSRRYCQTNENTGKRRNVAPYVVQNGV